LNDIAHRVHKFGLAVIWAPEIETP